MREPHRSGVLCPPARACRRIATRIRSATMPLYIIERAFAEQLDLTTDDVRLLEQINADEGVRWVFSFLSADRRHTYCLYEAPFAEAIMAAARRANIPLTLSSRSKHRPSESRAARRPGPQRNLTHSRRKPAAPVMPKSNCDKAPAYQSRPRPHGSRSNATDTPQMGELLPRVEDAYGVRKKLVDYSLKAGHPSGRRRDSHECSRSPPTILSTLPRRCSAGSVRRRCPGFGLRGAHGFHCEVMQVRTSRSRRSSRERPNRLAERHHERPARSRRPRTFECA